MFQFKKLFTYEQFLLLASVFTIVYGGVVFVGILYVIFLKLS